MLLQDIYKNRSSLVVVFISEKYQEKKWCGVEFRAIRNILFNRQDERIMYIRTDDGSVDGVFDTDGYVDARNFSALDIVGFILDRLHVLGVASDLFLETATSQPELVSQPSRAGIEKNKIVGKWNLEVAKRMVEQQLENHDWDISQPYLEMPLQHSFAGDYHLFYKSKEGIILAFGTISEGADCHACAPYLSLFEFERHGNGWELVTSDVAISRFGQWGRLPKLGVHAIAADRYGIFLQDGYMAQGWGVGITSVHVCVGDKFKQVLNLITSQMNPEGQGWNSKLTMRTTASGLYDIEVKRLSEDGMVGMVFMDGDADLKGDVADYDDRIRSSDVFKFDGQYYRRHELLT